MPRLAATTRTLRTWLDPLVDFCFPRQCPACKTPFDSARFLCDACSPELQNLLDAPACHQCAMPAAFDDVCPHCLSKGVYPFERIAGLGMLKKPLQQMVHAVKYHRRWPLAQDLVELAAHRPAVRAVMADADLLVPVPLFPLKQIERGYNQAEVIARNYRVGSTYRSST